MNEILVYGCGVLGFAVLIFGVWFLSYAAAEHENVVNKECLEGGCPVSQKAERDKRLTQIDLHGVLALLGMGGGIALIVTAYIVVAYAGLAN